MEAVAIIIFAFVVAIVTVPITQGLVNDSWRVEAVAHGYAHFEHDHSFHWNDESPKR